MPKILSQIVEVCIFRWVSGEPQYLLLQRAENETLYPGLWQIVTGEKKKNERAEATALRELTEETGLRVKRFWSVPFIDSYYDSSKDAVQMIPVFAVEVDPVLAVQLSPEHKRFQWLVLTDARERIVWPGQRNVIDTVHEFIIGGKEAARLLEISKF